MNHDKTIYKVIPFAEVAIGQAFQSDTWSSIGDSPWIKLTETDYGCGIGLDHVDGLTWFTRGCLVRIADCKPQDSPKAEPVKTLRDEIAIAAMQGMRAAGIVHSRGIALDAYAQADAMLLAREGNNDE